MDFFDRHDHAADIVLAAELDGFTHREIALTAAVVRAAGDETRTGRALAPLVRKEDRAAIECAGVMLALADDIVERCPPGAPMTVDVQAAPDGCVVTVDGLAGWRPRKIDARFARVFAMPLTVR